MMAEFSRMLNAAALTVAVIFFGTLNVCGQDTAPSSQPAEDPPRSEDKTPPVQEKPDKPAQLEEVVVTATRGELKIFDAPCTVQALDSDYIVGEKQARTLPDALFEVPGVLVQKTSHGQGSPFIRGFTGFRTLLMVDGIRVNNSVFREGPNQYWNTVDPFSIGRLEVVKGPASVLYGSDAVGGAVNVFTPDLKPSEQDFEWSRRMLARWSSAEESFTGRGEISASFDKKLLMLSGFDLKDFNDLHAGKDVGELPKTGYDEKCGDFKLDWFLKPDVKLTLAYQQVDQNDAWRTHRTVYGKSWHGSALGTDQHLDFDQNRQLTYVALDLTDAATFFRKARFSVSLHDQSENQFRVDNVSRRTYQGFDVQTWGICSQFESSSPIGKLTYGIDYYRDDVTSYRRDPDRNPTVADPNIRKSPRGPVADDASYDMLGTFVQDEFSAGETFDFILGVRYTYAKATAGEVGLGDIGSNSVEVLPDLSESFDAFVGSFRATCHISDKLNAFCGVSQAFRAPNLSDLTSFDISRSGELETPSTEGLDPEKYLSYEIGLKTLTSPVSGTISYFFTDICDMIVRAPTGNIVDGSAEVVRKNGGEGFVQGIDLQVAWEISPEWRMFANFCWQEGELDTYPTAATQKEREPMSRMMPATAIAGVRWTHSSGKYWVEGLATIVNDQDRLSPDDDRDTQRIPPGGAPGYTVFTLRGGAELTENLKLSAEIENIGDKDYRVLGSGQNEAGTNFIISFDWSF